MGEAAVASGSAHPGAAGNGDGRLFATPQVAHERRSDGAIVLRSTRGLGAVPRSLGVLLERWAAAAPDRPFLAEREASGGWRHLTYEAAARAANSIGQSLLDRRLGPDRPLLILAENGIDHALMTFGAMHVGVPVVPVSTAYARLSQDYGKLRYIFDLVEPGLIYVDEADRYAKALDAIGATGVEIVASRGSLRATRLTPFSDADRGQADARRRRRLRERRAGHGGQDPLHVRLDGQPKGVVNTHGMLCANQEMLRRCWGFLTRSAAGDRRLAALEPHLRRQSQLQHGPAQRRDAFVDEGKPAPALIERTVANLREVVAQRLLQRAAPAMPCSCPTWRRTTSCAVLPARARLCSSTPPPRCRRTSGTAGWLSMAHLGGALPDVGLGLHRDRPARSTTAHFAGGPRAG